MTDITVTKETDTTETTPTIVTENKQPIITKAHSQTVTLRIIENIPSHAPRTSDKYYHFFNAAKSRMKKAGLLKCWVCGTEDDVECHHGFVEFCLDEDYDWSKFAIDHPAFGIVDDDTFQKFVEGESNLTPLCRLHHTGVLGIHFLNYPMWQSLKYLKSDVPIPAQVIRDNN